MKNKRVFRTWDSVQKELFTKKEIEESDIRVLKIGKEIERKRKLMKKYKLNYDKHSDILGIIFSDQAIKKDSKVNTVEVLTGIYVSINDCDNKISCIEIWDLSKKNLTELNTYLNAYLKPNYNLTIENSIIEENINAN